MKVGQLRQLIREEIQSVMKEQSIDNLFNSSLNEIEDNSLDSIIQKLKSKYKAEGITIKDNKIFFRTYHKNGSMKNWYTLEKMEDGNYRFAKGGIQKADGPIEKLLNYLLNSNID